jgi:CheY-like chemotaxis protein
LARFNGNQADISAAVEPMLRHHQYTSLGSRAGLTASRVSSDTEQPARILIIEDELLIALMIEEMVREIGYRVSAVAHTMAMASREFGKRNYDAVLLDINIGGRYHAVTADHLLGWGVPFAFVTGYDYLVEPNHEKVPVLQKPFTTGPAQYAIGRAASPDGLDWPNRSGWLAAAVALGEPAISGCALCFLLAAAGVHSWDHSARFATRRPGPPFFRRGYWPALSI